MTAEFTHPKPVVPAHLRQQSKAITQLDRALKAALRGNGTGEELAEAGMALIGSLNRKLTPEEQAEENRYEAEVRAYNAAAKAWNAALLAKAQARKNAVELAQMRRAACPVCFATHPGEC